MNFEAAYDALLRRWGELEQLELTGEFGTTHVNACGPTDAPPLVLLAGHGATSAVWYSVAPQLAANHRVYAVDLMGDAGRSVSNGTPLRTPEDLHRWLTEVLDGLDVDRADFCAHSYGAWIALSYALASPARVDRLALIDPTNCFTGLSARYVVRALPMLLRPTKARTTTFLRWETQGVPLDPAWLELSGLASELPAANPVRPRRPSAAALRDLHAALLVVVAGRSKFHSPERLTTRARDSSPRTTVVRIGEATHHSLPAAHTDELTAILAKHFGR
jgi:pimeloyl-ACP methyl ester carboxylesterase